MTLAKTRLEALPLPHLPLFSDLGSSLWERVRAADRSRARWSKRKTRRLVSKALMAAADNADAVARLRASGALDIELPRTPKWRYVALDADTPSPVDNIYALGIEARQSDAARAAILAFLVDDAGLVLDPPLTLDDLPHPLVVLYIRYQPGLSALTVPFGALRSNADTVAPRLPKSTMRELLDAVPSLRRADFRVADDTRLWEADVAAAAAILAKLPSGGELDPAQLNNAGRCHAVLRALIALASACGLQTRLTLDPASLAPTCVMLLPAELGNEDPELRIIRESDTSMLLALGPGAIAPGLWLGNLVDATSLATIRALGITAIVNVCEETFAPFARASSIRWLHFPLEDVSSQSLAETVVPATDALRELLAAGERVLLHCVVGKSRSVAIALAYFLLNDAEPLASSFARLQAVRPFVSPNSGFQTQLSALEMETLGTETPSIDWSTEARSTWGTRPKPVIPRSGRASSSSKRTPGSQSESARVSKRDWSELTTHIRSLCSSSVVCDDFIPLAAATAGADADDHRRVLQLFKAFLRHGLTIDGSVVLTELETVTAMLAHPPSPALLALRAAVASAESPARAAKTAVAAAAGHLSASSSATS